MLGTSVKTRTEHCKTEHCKFFDPTKTPRRSARIAVEDAPDRRVSEALRHLGDGFDPLDRENPNLKSELMGSAQSGSFRGERRHVV